MPQIPYNSNASCDVHMPAHHAIRLFLLTIIGGLVVVGMAGATFIILRRSTEEAQVYTTQTNTNSPVVATVAQPSGVHIHGTIIDLDQQSFTMRTQGVSDAPVPPELVVRYTDDVLFSIDTAQIPQPGNVNAPVAESIGARALQRGDTVDVTVSSVAADSTAVDALAVLQLR